MADMTQRLQLIVDATDSGSEATFQRITSAARDTGDAAQRSANDVADAANRVLAAQAKQADAAGQLRVAQQRLQDLQDKGGASAAQLAAAEERVEAAQRKVALASRDVEGALKQEERAQKDTAQAVDAGADAQERGGRASEKMREQVTELAGAAAGLVAGVSLADWAGESFTAFLDGARGAASLATSMNATVEQGGQLSVLFSSLGLEADDLLEIQAEFAQKVAASDDALGSMGATVMTNADGTTNWATTLTGALTQLQKIPDATERNRKGFALFGEEGYKQLSRLLNSGVSVQDALEQIGTPFSQEDVDATREYDQAMQSFGRAAGGAGRDLARELVPVVTAGVQAFSAAGDVIGAIPAPLGLATAGAVLFGIASRSAATEGGLLAGAMGSVQGAAGRFTGSVAAASTGTGVLATSMGVARVAGSGLVGVLGGPVGIAIAGVGAAFAVLNAVTGENAEEAAAAEQSNKDLADALKESKGVLTATVREQAAATAQANGMLTAGKALGIQQGVITDALLGNKAAYQQVIDKANAYIDASLTAEHAGDKTWTENATAAQGLIDSLGATRDETMATADAQEELAGELGQVTDKAALATAAHDALTAAIDAGTTSGQAFTDAVKGAADAQAAADATTDLATAAIEAYHAATDGAVQATRDLQDAQLSAEDAQYGYLDALDDLNAARDDETTSVDEVAQAHTAYKEAALGAADAAADAAVQAATAAGTVLTPLEEANTRADALVGNLRENLNRPGLSDGAKADLQGLIDQLTTAQDKGDVQALITLTGVDQAQTELDSTTEDRTAPIVTESRGGPAVISYLDGIASTKRLAIVNVESRGGPAVEAYLEGLRIKDRLAIINVESRGGPAVDTYLDGIAAAYRLAIINVETRGGPAVDTYLDNLAGQTRTAVIQVQRTGATGSARAPIGYGAPAVAGVYGAAPTGSGDVIIHNMTVQPQVDGGGRLTSHGLAEVGRSTVAALRAYERDNGKSWRTT